MHAGAGGVGSATIQLGKAAGATVIATAGGAERRRSAASSAPTSSSTTRPRTSSRSSRSSPAGRGADVVFDPVGGDVFDKSRKCIAFEGRLVVIGFASGRIPEPKANHVCEELQRPRPVLGPYVIPRRVRHAASALRPLCRGPVEPLVSCLAPMAEAPGRWAVASRATTGKVVLVP